MEKFNELNPNRVSFTEFANYAKLPCTRVLVHRQYDTPRGATVTYLEVIGMPKRYNLFLGCIADECVSALLRFFNGSKDAEALKEALYWLPKKPFKYEEEEELPYGLRCASSGCDSDGSIYNEEMDFDLYWDAHWKIKVNRNTKNIALANKIVNDVLTWWIQIKDRDRDRLKQWENWDKQQDQARHNWVWNY